ncbi:MAG: cell division protein FtsZ, partial [Rhodococcus sp. (in: high G+C Gram-positive bacteria)]
MVEVEGSGWTDLYESVIHTHGRREPMTPPHNYLAVIKVVGIGGGGVNAVNR